MPARHAGGVEQVAQSYAGPLGAGAPALHAGDRQGLGALGELLEVGARPAHRRPVGVDDVEGPGRAALLQRDLGGRGRPVDRDALRSVAGAHGEDRHVAQERHGAAGGGEHRDPGGRPRRAQQAAAAQHAWLHGGVAVVRGVLDVAGERVADDRQLDRDVHDQRADRDPGHGVVGRAEGEAPGVPLGGVEEPADEHEDAAGDEHGDRDPLERGHDHHAHVAQRHLARTAWGRPPRASPAAAGSPRCR